MEILEAILPDGKKDINDISSEEHEKLTWRISQTSIGVDEPVVLRARANGNHKLNKIIEACKEDGRIIRAPLTSEEPFTLKAAAMRTNGLERYEKSEIPFRIAFTDDLSAVSITTDNNNYAYLNRTFGNEKPEYLYLRTISWIAEISRIVKCKGDYAVFEK